MNETPRAPINWPATLMLGLTTLPVIAVLPFYLWNHSVGAAVWIWALVFLSLNELSITAGYHRLWAHRAYKAHPALKTGSLDIVIADDRRLLFRRRANGQSLLCLFNLSPEAAEWPQEIAATNRLLAAVNGAAPGALPAYGALMIEE